MSARMRQVRFAFRRHSIPELLFLLPEEDVNAMIASKAVNGFQRTLDVECAVRHVGGRMKELAVQACKSIQCEFCCSPATGMASFVIFDATNQRFSAIDEWFHCDKSHCKDQAQYKSKKGDDAQAGNFHGDSCCLFAVPSQLSEAQARAMIENIDMKMGPGAALATDLGAAGGTKIRIDFTEAVVKFVSVDSEIRVTVPYKKMTAIDPNLKFPRDWSLERARAAGFIGNEHVSGDIKSTFTRQICNSAVAKLFDERRIMCTICSEAKAVGSSLNLAYIPAHDGCKGTFVSPSDERWVCESTQCLGAAANRTRKEAKRSGVKRMCANCCDLREGEQGTDGRGSCAKCHQVYYCSRSCQLSDWERHKPLCKAMVKAKLRKQMQAGNAK